MTFSGHALRRAAGLTACVAIAATLFFVSSESRTRLLVLNSLKLAAGAGALSLPLGTLLAFLLVRTDVPGRRAALVLLAGLLFLPLYLQALAWDAGFGTHGWYSLARTARSQPMSATVADVRAWQAAIWIHGVAALPWVLLIVGSGLRFVEPELEEQALLDGSLARVLTRVTLPRVIVPVGAAALWVLVSTFGEMTVTDLYQVRTYAEEVYTGFAAGDNLREATIQTLPAVAMLAGLVVASMILFSTAAPSPTAAGRRPPPTFRLGIWRPILGVFVWIIVAAVVGLPLGNLAYRAGVVVPQVGGRHWSPEKFAQVLRKTPSVFWEDFYGTLWIAGLAATTAVLIGVPLGWRARLGGYGLLPATLTAAICLSVPGPLIGLWIIWGLNRPGWSFAFWLYDKTIFAPVLAATVRCLPVTIFIVWQALRSVSDDVLEAAATAGAGALRRFWHMAWRPRKCAMLAAWLAAFAVAAADLSAINLVLPPRVTTLSYRIFSLIHQGVLNQEACLGLLSVAVFWALALTFTVALTGVGRRGVTKRRR